MFTQIDHVALHVKDVSKTISFYKEVFGFSILFENIIPTGQKVTYLKLGETILEVNEIYEGEIQGSHFCLHTSDFKADYDYLLGRGVKLLQPVHSTNPRALTEEGWLRAVFLGVNGEQIEIRGK